MAKKRSDVIQENLESGDTEQISWEGQLDKKNGYIVLSKKKLLFIEEHGFLNKTATLLLNHPYKDIRKVELHRDQVNVTDANGATHIFYTKYANHFFTKLEDLKQQAV